MTLHDLNQIHDGTGLSGPLRLRLSLSHPRFIIHFRALVHGIDSNGLVEHSHSEYNPQDYEGISFSPAVALVPKHLVENHQDATDSAQYDDELQENEYANVDETPQDQNQEAVYTEQNEDTNAEEVHYKHNTTEAVSGLLEDDNRHAIDQNTTEADAGVVHHPDTEVEYTEEQLDTDVDHAEAVTGSPAELGEEATEAEEVYEQEREEDYEREPPAQDEVDTYEDPVSWLEPESLAPPVEGSADDGANDADGEHIVLHWGIAVKVCPAQLQTDQDPVDIQATVADAPGSSRFFAQWTTVYTGPDIPDQTEDIGTAHSSSEVEVEDPGEFSHSKLGKQTLTIDIADLKDGQLTSYSRDLDTQAPLDPPSQAENTDKASLDLPGDAEVDTQTAALTEDEFAEGTTSLDTEKASIHSSTTLDSPHSESRKRSFDEVQGDDESESDSSVALDSPGTPSHLAYSSLILRLPQKSVLVWIEDAAAITPWYFVPCLLPTPHMAVMSSPTHRCLQPGPEQSTAYTLCKPQIEIHGGGQALGSGFQQCEQVTT